MSTTRPETMLGDVAVAVHPEDPRYQASTQLRTRGRDGQLVQKVKTLKYSEQCFLKHEV